VPKPLFTVFGNLGDLFLGLPIENPRDQIGWPIPALNSQHLLNLHASNDQPIRSFVRSDNLERHWLRPDDILITLRNRPLRAAVIPIGFEQQHIAGPNLAVLRPYTSSKLEPVYLCGLLRSGYGQRLTEPLFSQSSMTPLIKLSELKQLIIPMPSLETQQHLAALMLAAERAEYADLERIQTRHQIIEATLHQTLGSPT
jgi:hypothetical protein